MTATTEVDVNELDKLLATFRKQGLSGERTLADFQWFAALTRGALDELMTKSDKLVQTRISFLRCFSEGTEIVIEATEGKRTIPDAKTTFPGGIDPNFTKCGLGKPGVAKPATSVKVHETGKDANFAQMFGSLGERKNLCFTQDQIITFCEEHSQWLCLHGCATFFLLEDEGRFFVADVFFRDVGRLGVRAYHFSYGNVWLAEGRHRVVVPQL